MSNIYLIWFVVYFVPALFCIFEVRYFKNNSKLRTILAHVLLIISILSSFYFISQSDLGFRFLDLNYMFYLFLILTIGFYFYIHSISFAYSISSFIQELSMLSVVIILFGQVHLFFIVLMIVPVFVLSHESKNKKIMWSLTLIWGILSVILFAYFQNIWFHCIIHFFFGSVLIKKNVITYEGNNINYS